jgi:hypothetical protein
LVTSEVWSLARCGHKRGVVTSEVWSLARCGHFRGGNNGGQHLDSLICHYC